MPEPLKNLYNQQLITNLSQEVGKQYPAFNQQKFITSIFNKGWKNKELKQRMRHIAECLHSQLPVNYKAAIKILKPVSAKFNGFEYMFFQDYVECYGLHDFTTSMNALARFTKYASSEFAVRAFILQDERRMMKQMLKWAESDNHHVRRLASEGCRPRLPWAVALPVFKNNPAAILALLETLMLDESEYVRRSVANNLNDISKDHPALVTNWAKKWLGTNKDCDRLVKHGCRTLLKAGDQKTLLLFGYSKPKHLKLSLFKLQETVKIGNKLAFSFLLASTKTSQKNNHIGKCRIEFAIDFVKANGSLSKKVFKISEGNYEVTKKQVSKYYSLKKISTRKYYVGQHHLSIIINGATLATKKFHMTT